MSAESQTPIDLDSMAGNSVTTIRIGGTVYHGVLEDVSFTSIQGGYGRVSMSFTVVSGSPAANAESSSENSHTASSAPAQPQCRILLDEE